VTPRLRELPVFGPRGFYRLAYTEWGPANAQRTVLCVHGVSRNGRDFDFLARALAERGMRVVAPDLPGRGSSDWLPSSLHYTDAEYTSAMAALVGRLDVTEIDWVGTSLGGYIGMLLAAQPGTPIRRLVLNDFGARVAATALRRIGAYLNTRWRFDNMDEVEAHLRQIHAPFGKLTDAQWQHLVAHSAVATDDGKLRFHYDPAIGARFAIPLWADLILWSTWEMIACPVLILRGAESDLLSSRTAQEMTRRGIAASRGQVELVEIAGSGHAPSLLMENQIRLIVDFLSAERDDGSAAESSSSMSSIGP
jgi:pimeloyl-ACP methyl ester carboxylesterase